MPSVTVGRIRAMRLLVHVPAPLPAGHRPRFTFLFLFFPSRRRHTRLQGDWSSDVCSSDLGGIRRCVSPVPGNACTRTVEGPNRLDAAGTSHSPANPAIAPASNAARTLWRFMAPSSDSGELWPKPPRGVYRFAVMTVNTLERVIGTLGRGVVSVACAPNGLDIEVHDVVVHDLVDPFHVTEGDLVLGVSLTPWEALRIVDDLASKEVAALLLKAPVLSDGSVAEAAEKAGLAVLSVPSGASWSQIIQLVQSVLSHGAVAADD